MLVADNVRDAVAMCRCLTMFVLLTFCILTTLMDAMIGLYHAADRDAGFLHSHLLKRCHDRAWAIPCCRLWCHIIQALDYQRHLTCIHSTYDQKRIMYVELVVMLLRLRDLMLQMCSREEGYAALEGIKQKLLDKNMSEEAAEQSLSTEVRFGCSMPGVSLIK